MMWILIVFVVIAVIYVLLMHPYKYWIKRGVKQGKPFLIFGDNWGIFLHKQSIADMAQMAYNISPNSRYCGIYQFVTPSLVLRDPDLIKQITVKDFDHFLNHPAFIPEQCDPLLSKNLFFLTDQKWRDMRSTLSPAFTSSKMKFMFSLISESGEQFAQYFLRQNQNLITIEMKDTFTRFTNDVIASSAFGVKCDSLSERNNEFYLMGKEATDLRGFWRIIKMTTVMIFPKLSKIYNATLYSKRVSRFFTKLIQDNIASREKHGIVRPDMIHLLLEARKSGLKYEESQQIQDTGFATVEESVIGKNSTIFKQTMADADITAQALIFFFGGFDSVSSLMCFMSYELGINPDVQEKLRQEIDETLATCNNKLTYEALTNMKYMDMVVSETLRMWPTGVFFDRTCTKPYTIEPKTPDEKPLHLQKNDIVWISIYGLHRDAKYFPDPDRFDPERFNAENRANIQPYTYLPFGSGPRNCIGSRFALLETKVLFFHILSHFEIVPVKKTQVPLQLSKKSFSMTAENGFWLGLQRKNE